MPPSRLEAAFAIAMELSDVDRVKLIDLIYGSLPEGQVEYGAEDLAEWNRRLEEINSGRAKTIPFEDVMNELRKKYGWENSDSERGDHARPLS